VSHDAVSARSQDAVSARSRVLCLIKGLGPGGAERDGWYSVEVRHQPTLNTDRVRVSVDVPDGWRIDQAPHMRKQYARLATTSRELQRTTTFRVHITQDPSAWDIWERLRVGT